MSSQMSSPSVKDGETLPQHLLSRCKRPGKPVKSSWHQWIARIRWSAR